MILDVLERLFDYISSQSPENEWEIKIFYLYNFFSFIFAEYFKFTIVMNPCVIQPLSSFPILFSPLRELNEFVLFKNQNTQNRIKKKKERLIRPGKKME